MGLTQHSRTHRIYMASILSEGSAHACRCPSNARRFRAPPQRQFSATCGRPGRDDRAGAAGVRGDDPRPPGRRQLSAMSVNQWSRTLSGIVTPSSMRWAGLPSPVSSWARKPDGFFLSPATADFPDPPGVRGPHLHSPGFQPACSCTVPWTYQSPAGSTSIRTLRADRLGAAPRYGECRSAISSSTSSKSSYMPFLRSSRLPRICRISS